MSSVLLGKFQNNHKDSFEVSEMHCLWMLLMLQRELHKERKANSNKRGMGFCWFLSPAWSAWWASEKRMLKKDVQDVGKVLSQCMLIKLFTLCYCCSGIVFNWWLCILGIPFFKPGRDELVRSSKSESIGWSRVGMGEIIGQLKITCFFSILRGLWSNPRRQSGHLCSLVIL